MFYIFAVIFLLSLILAARSMRDFGVPNEIKQLLVSRKVRGTIMFFKDMTKHYHG